MKVIIDNVDYVPVIPLGTNMTFSELINMYRIRQNLTMQQASDIVGCSKSFMWEMENKQVSVGLDILKKIHTELNIPAVYLLTVKRSKLND